MTITNMKKWAAVAVCAICTPLAAHATAVPLGGPIATMRAATLDSAQAGQGHTGTGNATVTDVNGYYGGSWTERGSVTTSSAGGANGGLLIVLTSGSWGGNSAAGTWQITTANFWTTYGDAAISLHVGNGNGEPDHFVWLLTDGATSGTWSLDGSCCQGGGLSNLKLYTRGTGTPDNNVPEGGATVALLGFALCGLGLIRARLVKA